MSEFADTIGSEAVKWAIIVGGVLAAGLYISKKLGSGNGQGPANVANAAANTLTAAITGNTFASDYKDAGLIGTLGAATNEVSGNVFDWLGNKVGGLFAPSYDPNAYKTNASDGASDALANNVQRDYFNGGGNSTTYGDAWSNAPSDPAYAATSLQTGDETEPDGP